MDENSLDSSFILGYNPIVDININIDTMNRISNMTSLPKVEAIKLDNSSVFDNISKRNDNIEDIISNKNPITIDEVEDMMVSKDNNIVKKGQELYSQLFRPKLQKYVLDNVGIITPYQKGQEKFTEDHWWSEKGKTKYGFNPYKTLAENENFYHENVWNSYSIGGKLWRGAGTIAGRIGEGILSGLGKTASYIGSGLYYGIQDIFEDESKGDTNFIASVGDNAMARWLEEQDEKFKEQVLPVWRSIDYDNKGFFSKMADATFWQEDFADMASFALQAMIPGTAFGRLGMLAKLGNTSKFARIVGTEAGGFLGKGLQFTTGSKNLAGIGGWAFNTANEAFVESAGVQKSVKEKLIEERRQGLNDYTDEKINQTAADAAAKDFKYNLAILAASNAFENRLFGKLLKGDRGNLPNVLRTNAEGLVERSVADFSKFGTYLNPINYLEKIPKLGKYFENTSRLGFYGRKVIGLDGLKGFVMEALWEENAQLAAQRISEGESYTATIEGGGKKNVNISDGNDVTKFFKQLGNQTLEAYRGNDVEAATSIGSGALLGTGMVTGTSLATRERKNLNKQIDGYTRDVVNKEGVKTKEYVKGVIERVKDARDSMFSYTDVYETEEKNGVKVLKLDDNGKPIINQEKKDALLTKFNNIHSLLETGKMTIDEDLRNLQFKTAYSKYMHEIFKVDGQAAVYNNLKSIGNKTKTEADYFGIQFGELENNPNDYIEYGKQLHNIYKKAEELEYYSTDKKRTQDEYDYIKSIGRGLYYDLQSSNLANNELLESLKNKNRKSFQNEGESIVYDSDDKSVAFSLYSLLEDMNLNEMKIQHFEKNAEEYKAQGYDIKERVNELKTKNKSILDRYSAIYPLSKNAEGFYTENGKDAYVDIPLLKAAQLSNNIDVNDKQISLISDKDKGLSNIVSLIDNITKIAADKNEKAEQALAENIKKEKEEEEIRVLNELDKSLGFSYELNDKIYTTFNDVKVALDKGDISITEFNDILEYYNKLKKNPPKADKTEKELSLEEQILELLNKKLTDVNYKNTVEDVALYNNNKELFEKLYEENKDKMTAQVRVKSEILGIIKQNNTLNEDGSPIASIEVNDKGESVYNILGKIYQRVSNYIGNSINRFKDKSTLENLTNATTAGNYFDFISRLLLENPDASFEDVSLIIDKETENAAQTGQSSQYNYFKLHEKALFDNIKAQVLKVKEEILKKHPDGYIISKEALLKLDKSFKNYDGVAGTTDVLVIDNQGVVHIYDFKTKKAGKTENILDKLNSKYDDKSNIEGYTAQQSAYKQLLESYGIKTGDINLIVFPISYANELFVGDFNNNEAKLAYNPSPLLLNITQDAVIIPLSYKKDDSLVPDVQKEYVEETPIEEPVSNQSEIEVKIADIERRRQEELNKANKQIEKTNKKEDRRLKVETYRTLDIGGNPVEVEITTNADGSRLLRARQVNEDGSIEPMAYVTERINNKSQATLTNEKLIEGYIGNEDNTLQRTNVDENPNQTHIDKINAKYDAELKALEQPTTSNQSKIEAKKAEIDRLEKEADNLLTKGVNNSRYEREQRINKGEAKNVVEREQQIEWLKTKDGIRYQQIQQDLINLKTYFHGTAEIRNELDNSKSNTSKNIFLTENEDFANSFSFNDEFRPNGVTYTANINVKKTFQFDNPLHVEQFRELIKELVKNKFKDSNIGINFNTPFGRDNATNDNSVENPTQEQLVDLFIWRLENGSWRMLETKPFEELLNKLGYDSFKIVESKSNTIAVKNNKDVSLISYKDKNGKVSELKSLEEQSATSNQSEIEVKIADIERRRQEELLVPISLIKLPQYLAETIKKAVERLSVTQRYDIVKAAINGKTAQQIVSELNLIDENGRRDTEIVRQVRAYYGIPSLDAEGYKDWKISIDKINAKYDAELKALEQPITSNQSKKADIEKRRQEDLDNVKPVYHHTQVKYEDFNFSSFQRGKASISQFGDGLNASTDTTSFLVNRYGKPIQGEVNIKDFIEIDANKSEKELYEYLKAKGYNFSKPASEYKSNEKANEQPAIIELFQDFQKSNPKVKGVKVNNHIIGGQKVSPFYVIYDNKSFYGQDSLKNKINSEYDAELKALESGNNSTLNAETLINDGNNQQEGSSEELAEESAGKLGSEFKETEKQIVKGKAQSQKEEREEMRGLKAYVTPLKTITRATETDEKGRDKLTEDGNAIVLQDDKYEYASGEFMNIILDDLNSDRKSKFTFFIVKDTEEWIKERLPKEKHETALAGMGYVILVKDNKGNILNFNGKSFTKGGKGVPLLYSIDNDVFENKDGGLEERASIKKERMYREDDSITEEMIIEQYKKEIEDRKKAFSLLKEGKIDEIMIDAEVGSYGILPRGVDASIFKRFGDNVEFKVNEAGSSILFTVKGSDTWMPLHTRMLSLPEAQDIQKLLDFLYEDDKEAINIVNYIKNLVYLSNKEYEFNLTNVDGKVKIELSKNKSIIKAIDLQYNVLMNIPISKDINVQSVINEDINVYKIDEAGKLVKESVPYNVFLENKLFTNILAVEYKGERNIKRIQGYFYFSINDDYIKNNVKEESKEEEEDKVEDIVKRKVSETPPSSSIRKTRKKARVIENKEIDPGDKKDISDSKECDGK